MKVRFKAATLVVSAMVLVTACSSSTQQAEPDEAAATQRTPATTHSGEDRGPIRVLVPDPSGVDVDIINTYHGILSALVVEHNADAAKEHQVDLGFLPTDEAGRPACDSVDLLGDRRPNAVLQLATPAFVADDWRCFANARIPVLNMSSWAVNTTIEGLAPDLLVPSGISQVALSRVVATYAGQLDSFKGARRLGVVVSADVEPATVDRLKTWLTEATAAEIAILPAPAPDDANFAAKFAGLPAKLRDAQVEALVVFGEEPINLTSVLLKQKLVLPLLTTSGQAPEDIVLSGYPLEKINVVSYRDSDRNLKEAAARVDLTSTAEGSACLKLMEPNGVRLDYGWWPDAIDLCSGITLLTSAVDVDPAAVDSSAGLARALASLPAVPIADRWRIDFVEGLSTGRVDLNTLSGDPACKCLVVTGRLETRPS